MKHNPKVSRISSFVTRLSIMLVLLMITSGFAEQPKTLPVGQVPDNVKALLTDYSQHLGSGNTLHQSFYSNAMETLAQERRNYYNEFYSVGLHANLTSVKSQFHMEDATVTKTGNVFHVEVLETVTMFGFPNLSSAEDYPMIPAARWAISQTDNENVKKALDEYITNTTDAVNDSILNGAETEFRVKHKIDIVETKNNRVQFVKDMFTDKEIDNGNGLDNVDWVNSHSARLKPDLTQMPDYKIYHTTTEVLGQQLLDDYTNAYGGVVPNSTGFTYSRSAASNYALTYSSAATSTCPNNTSIFMNTAVYNQTSIYKNIWTVTTSTCNDCADFISQALRAGGFPVDSTWTYSGTYGGYPGTYTWKVFDFSTNPKGLAYYLQTSLGAISVYSSNTSLQVGDLMYDNNLHVVMVTAVAPTKYSGHTNDRKNAAYVTSLNHYWHVLTNVP